MDYLAIIWTMPLRVYDQTWTFVEMHRVMVESSRLWKCAMSSRCSDVGSGFKRLAERVAFAMAS